ncbi:MAG: hypothetical protein ACQ9ET_00830 [Nitrosomonadaceae bacterium]
MKILKFAVFSIIFLSIWGCAGIKYVHPTKHTQAEYQKDWYDCKMAAVQYSHAMGAPSNPLIIGPEIHECMQMKHGWKQTTEKALHHKQHKQGDSTYMTQAHDCIATHGKNLEPVQNCMINKYGWYF